MFEHSIPVPRLYRSAAKIAENVNNNKGSLKDLVYQTKHPVSSLVLCMLYLHNYQNLYYIFRILKPFML